MNLNKFIHYFGDFMDRKFNKCDKKAFFENLRVQLIPISLSEGNGLRKFKTVRGTIASMVGNLHRRGRPLKSEEDGIENAA